jgi:predicted deacylase
MLAAVGLLTVLAGFGVGLPAAYAVSGSVTSLATTESVTPTAPPSPTWTPIGYSVLGRPIQAIRLGSGPNHVLIIAGLHGNEYGYDVASKLVVYLLANPSAVPAGTQLDVIASANPDGRVRRRRGNARGVDLNRNFPARNWRRIKKRGATAGPFRGSEPETQAIMRFMEVGGYSRVISLHSRGPLVDYDGPGAKSLARRFSRIARIPVVRLASSGHYYGSMGNWVPQRYRIPIVTIELKNRTLPVRLRSGILAVVR